MGKGYCDQGLFVLNISEVINEFGSSTYIVDSYDVWHARLGHVNYSYVMKLQRLGLINMHEKQNSKCDICVESKIMKKTCHYVERQTEIPKSVRVMLPNSKKRKIGSKTSNCMFLGYAEHSVAHGFLILNSDIIEHKTIVETKKC